MDDRRWSSNPKNKRLLYIIVEVLVVLLIIATIYIIAAPKGGKPENLGIGIVFAAYEKFTPEKRDIIYSLAKQAVNDENPETSDIIDIKSMFLAPYGEEFNEGEYNWFTFYESTESMGHTVFILDDWESKIYGERGDFDDLSEMGFDTADGESYRVHFGNTYGEGQGAAEYVCLQTWKDEDNSRRETAIKFVKLLTDYEW